MGVQSSARLILAFTLCFFWRQIDAQGSGIENSVASPTRAVDKHNELRRIPGASNMKMLVWDDAIANASQTYAEKCIFSHDRNRGSVGENIYISSGSPSELLAAATQDWHNEVADFDYDMGCASGKTCGHYTQVVWADSAKLGCGAAHCPTVQGLDGFANSKIVVCRYSPPGNFVNVNPYAKGTACSSCPTGWACNDGLCQDPSTIPTTDPSTSTTVSTSESPSSTASSTIVGTQSTSTSSGTDGGNQTPPSSTEDQSLNPPTSTVQSTSTFSSTDGSTISPIDTTGITPQNGCSAEYRGLLEAYHENLQKWSEAFENWKQGFPDCRGDA